MTLSILIPAWLGGIGFLSGVQALIIGFSCMGITLFVVSGFFSKNHQREEERRAKEEEQKLENLRKITCPAMVQKLQSAGFSSLNQVEKSYLFKLSDQMGNNLENLHENEIKVLELAFSNQGVFNMLQMRNSQLQANTSLKHLKNIRTSSFYSGVNAAGEIGEHIGERFSE